VEEGVNVTDDIEFMRTAMGLAAKGLGLASPNPMVGAVVVAAGRVVGEGWHEGPGTPHAEVMALSEAGLLARGATLVVTLEPCNHHGRTPPCTDAIVAAGIARVLAAARDPNPIVDGRGFDALRAAGVRVEEGMLAEEASDAIAGFAKHVRNGGPFVTLKMAASLDGKVAARDGSSRWITGAPAREDVHRLRAASDAIVVGSGTALADDPSLTVRLDGYRGRPPLRVLVDGAGRVPATGKLFDGSAPTMVVTTDASLPRARAAWEAVGAEVALFEPASQEGPGALRVPLERLVEHLGKRGSQTVLIEGGPTLAWAAIEAGMVDRFVLYLAPTLIGGERAPGVLGGDGTRSIADARRVTIGSVEQVGEDIKVVAYVHRDR
jgi:diaminohydroxyphosphoribosylaminopyrimidine deaminase/5-amino-6-(5-phosphoribosylamino)uracil reductase